MTSEIIIYNDLPFRYVEFEKVTMRDIYLNRDCQSICRQTNNVDVFKRFQIEKEKVKDVFYKASRSGLFFYFRFMDGVC